jgi:hypothetical protein
VKYSGLEPTAADKFDSVGAPRGKQLALRAFMRYVLAPE